VYAPVDWCFVCGTCTSSDIVVSFAKSISPTSKLSGQRTECDCRIRFADCTLTGCLQQTLSNLHTRRLLMYNHPPLCYQKQSNRIRFCRRSPSHCFCAHILFLTKNSEDLFIAIFYADISRSPKQNCLHQSINHNFK